MSTALDDLVAAVARAERAMNNDTRHPAYYAVPNRVVLDMVKAARRLEAEHAAATARPAMRDGEHWDWFTLNDEAAFQGIICGHPHRHNGPRFLRDQVERIIADQNRLRKTDPDSYDELRWSADDPAVLEQVSVTYNAAGDSLRPGDEPLVERSTPDERGLYTVGDGWLWEYGELPRVSLHKTYAPTDRSGR